MDEELEPEFVDVEQEALDVQDVEAEQEQDVLESNLVYDDAYEQYPENTWENGEEMDELSPFFLFQRDVGVDGDSGYYCHTLAVDSVSGDGEKDLDESLESSKFESVETDSSWG